MNTIAKITGAEFDANVYRKIEILVVPNPLAPRCLPNAILDTRELFEVL